MQGVALTQFPSGSQWCPLSVLCYLPSSLSRGFLSALLGPSGLPTSELKVGMGGDPDYGVPLLKPLLSGWDGSPVSAPAFVTPSPSGGHCDTHIVAGGDFNKLLPFLQRASKQASKQVSERAAWRWHPSSLLMERAWLGVGRGWGLGRPPHRLGLGVSQQAAAWPSRARGVATATARGIARVPALEVAACSLSPALSSLSIHSAGSRWAASRRETCTRPCVLHK